MNLREKISNNLLKKWKMVISLTIAASILSTTIVSVSASMKNYTITDGEAVTKLTAIKSEANDILEKAGIKLNGFDKFTVDECGPKDIAINIKRAFKVEVTVDSKTKQLDTAECTVRDFLSEQGIALGENDEINVNLDELTYQDMKIAISRVEINEVKDQQVIPYSCVIKTTSDLKKGETKVETAGANGIKETIIKQKFIDGQLVESQVVSENVIQPAVDQVKLVGTKEPIKSKKKSPSTMTVVSSSGTFTDSNGQNVNYSKAIRGVCTAYCDVEMTSTGCPTQVGIVAVNPKVIPYGTRLYIPGYGYAVAGDTGGAMRSGGVLIDVYYNTEAECYRFGRKTLTVYIL